MGPADLAGDPDHEIVLTITVEIGNRESPSKGVAGFGRTHQTTDPVVEKLGSAIDSRFRTQQHHNDA